MGQRQGTILKKCTCALRSKADGRQRELSFTDGWKGIGRCRSGVGRQLAKTRS